jgi:hypothetical protein
MSVLYKKDLKTLRNGHETVKNVHANGQESLTSVNIRPESSKALERIVENFHITVTFTFQNQKIDWVGVATEDGSRYKKIPDRDPIENFTLLSSNFVSW